MARLEETATAPLSVGETTTMTTKIGILADRPGSGKTYTSLALIASNPVLNMEMFHDPKIISMELMQFKIWDVKFDVVLKANLIICPKGVHAHWVDQCSKFMPPRFKVFHTKKFYKTDSDDILNNKYDVVILHENQYKVFCGRLESNMNKYKFQRVFIDDADAISIPGFELPKTNFVWMLTCMLDRIQTGHVTSRGLRYVCWNLTRFNIMNVTVRNQIDFIDYAMNLPPIQQQEIIVKFERRASIVDIHTMGCTNVPTIDRLISTIKERMSTQIATLNAQLEAYSGYMWDITKKKIEALERDLNHYVDRVTMSECPISMEDIKTRVVVPCCKRAFELSSLVNSLGVNNVCPVCRSSIRLNEIIVVGDTPQSDNLTKAAVLRKHLRDIFEENPNHKVFISGSNMWELAPVINQINAKSTCISAYAGDASAKIDTFKNGNVNIFMIESAKYFVGINLSNATHLICTCRYSYAHALGRVQRPGRTTPLKVINIFYDTNI